MKEAQKILDMFVSDGYSSDDIATKLTSMDIKFNLDGEKFTIIEDGSEESDEKTTILTCLSDIVDNTSCHAGFHENTFNKSVYSIVSVR